MKPTRLWVLAACALAATGCTRPAHEASRTTIQQYMEGVVNPAGDFLFHSVQEIADADGARLKAPRTDADWNAVREQLQVLHDAPDVLMAMGLKAAPPDFKAEHPGVESDPAWIQLQVDSHRADFDHRALRLRGAADVAMRAADQHDPLALERALDGVDKACESCHLHYFYPNDKRAQQAAKEDGIAD
jgi:cytochrome c556